MDTSPDQIPCRVETRLDHYCEIISVMAVRTGLFIMPVQIDEKKSDTDCQIPAHHSGMDVKNDTTEFHAFGIVSVKKEQIPDQI